MEEEKREAAVQMGTGSSFSLRKRVWLNIVLFVVTIFSTFFVGISLSLNFKYTEVLAQNSASILSLGEKLRDPQVISLSLIYMVVLLGILLGHELGHFLTCRYYKIDATLPYFIPAPTLIGTLGAFIKIKSPITQKKQLFDIGVAGPLTGFVLSIPALLYGLSLSKAVPPAAGGETFVFVFGEPLILKIFAAMVFNNIPADYSIYLHPIAFAGWVGILVTALNLFPVGQLDGGHVSYALFGKRSRNLAHIFLALFFVMGVFFWVGWFIWALLILFLGLRHPRVLDEEERLSPRRRFIGYVVILIFILSFIPDPIKGLNLFDVLKGIRF
jgi:membrane-associated protease RseP (regulator of RpoE activity)